MRAQGTCVVSRHKMGVQNCSKTRDEVTTPNRDKYLILYSAVPFDRTSAGPSLFVKAASVRLYRTKYQRTNPEQLLLGQPHVRLCL
jgi:hypothetical protein